MDAASEPFLRDDDADGALSGEARLAQPQGALTAMERGDGGDGGGNDGGSGGGAHGGSAIATTNMDSLSGGEHGGGGSTSKPRTQQQNDGEHGGSRWGLCGGGGGGDNGGGPSDAWAAPATETRFPWASLVLFVAVYGVGVVLCVALGVVTDEDAHLITEDGV